MAVFTQKEQYAENTGGKELETIIGPSVKVDGKFHGQGNIIIEGSVSGSIKTEQNLSIGRSAQVHANVSAANAQIAGTVHGAIKIKGRLDLKETAVIVGDIETEILAVAPGAKVNGRCTMIKDAEAAKATIAAIAPKKVPEKKK